MKLRPDDDVTGNQQEFLLAQTKPRLGVTPNSLDDFEKIKIVTLVVEAEVNHVNFIRNPRSPVWVGQPLVVVVGLRPISFVHVVEEYAVVATGVE